LIPVFTPPPPELANDLKCLINHIYGSFDPANRDHDHLIERAILAPTNKDVDALNDVAVASFPGKEHVF
ncbi:atp-dependent dna helicase pif1, partial [Nannochloropsis oceanica]